MGDEAEVGETLGSRWWGASPQATIVRAKGPRSSASATLLVLAKILLLWLHTLDYCSSRMGLDLFKSIYDIGTWESFWWGSQWTLSDEETKKAVQQIDSDLAKHELVGAGASLAFPPIAAFFAANSGLLRLIKSRIEGANDGRGVIVDFALNYRAVKGWWKFLIPQLHGPSGLNVSNVHSR
jgi:hypothetical protein